MTRKEQIKNAYKLPGDNAGFYDGYVEEGDTEEGARNIPLGKVGDK